MKGKATKHPQLPKRLFWEFKYEDIDWGAEYAVIIQRVIERGSLVEWEELIRFYGMDRVINTIKDEITYFPDEIIQDVCNYFELKPFQLKCYLRKQSNPRHSL